jgi:TPR repeat protein
MKIILKALFLSLAILSLASCAQTDPFTDTKIRAEKGYSVPQYELGLMYYNGKGILRDYAESVKWYRRSAEQGDADAQSNLGNMYYKGEGVPRDYTKAYAYWIIAGAKGNQYARNNLEKLKNEMTPLQIEKGQQRSRELLKELEAKAAGAKAK